jgi:integrase
VPGTRYSPAQAYPAAQTPPSLLGLLRNPHHAAARRLARRRCALEAVEKLVTGSYDVTPKRSASSRSSGLTRDPDSWIRSRATARATRWDRVCSGVSSSAGCSLRYGELAALQRDDIDITAGILTVRRSVAELARGPLVTGPTKSVAGRRSLTIPDFLLTDVKAHLDEFVAAGPDALILTGVKGAQLRRSNFTPVWRKATETAGLAGFHFHDLRHTGNTLAGEAGASLRELMDRMGHSTTRAALIYQHRTSARDKAIADAISKLARDEHPRSGTQRARREKNDK